MKNVSTITCHDVCNHGAALQAYALVHFLKCKGFNAQIIDYRPDYLRHEASFWAVDHPVWSRSILRRMIYRFVKFKRNRIFKKRRRAFDTFNEKYFPRTKRIYFSADELRKYPPEADLYICGSDQIWNTLFPNGRDSSFYLDFAPSNRRRISYAASFASETVPPEWCSFIREHIKMLDAVSVRETSALHILEKMGISAIHVVDPVFLIEPKEWRKIAEESSLSQILSHEKYLLLYCFDADNTSQSTVRIAERIAKSRGLKLFSVNNIKRADRTFYQYGPETFLALIKNASVVVSNSFHGTAFAVILQQEFWVTCRKENINARMIDFLATLGLEDRLIETELNMSGEDNNRIDWTRVHQKLAEQVTRSKDFLSIQLTGDGKDVL